MITKLNLRHADTSKVRKIPVIKGVRSLTNWSLKESKELVDSFYVSAYPFPVHRDEILDTVTIPVNDDSRLAEVYDLFDQAGVTAEEMPNVYSDEVRELTIRALRSGNLTVARTLVETLETLETL